MIPLSPDRKRALSAVRLTTDPSKIRVYLKGAPEYIIDKCSATHAKTGEIDLLEYEQQQQIMNEIISEKFT